ncbi:Zn-ribbon domain-containing OB-fold protein [Natronomonas amylolytica]|uniref:Zn-ribbon domain-containing OB-fold protein n=1 Tax=Natronomonas amylolytica TaxID=3108498 RepID=UPI00300810FB
MSFEMRHDGYDDLLDAIEEDGGYYLACPNGHGTVPPRRVCPDCGSRELTERPLPEKGEILAATTISVAGPQFEDDAPYVTAIADFGNVRLTGLVRGSDAEPSPGDAVVVGIGETVTENERALVFRLD